MYTASYTSDSHHKWWCDDSTGTGETFVVSTACCYYRRQPAPLSPRKGPYFGVRSENWAKHGECCCSRISEIYLPSTASWPEKRGTVIIIAHTDDIYWGSHCPCFLLYGSNSPTFTGNTNGWISFRSSLKSPYFNVSIITLLTMTVFHPDFKIVFWDDNENAVTMEEGETFRKCFPFNSFDCSITVTSLFHQVRPDQREH